MELDKDQMLLPCQDLVIVEQGNSKEENSKRVKSITGYTFRDPILLQQAFTHHSYEDGSCASLERLAYVGDSVLNLLIAKEQYSLYPDLDPGRLTRLRAVNVDTEKLARVALKHDLHKLLCHNKILLSVQIKEFTNAIVEYPLHSSGLIDAPKVLADIVESLIGAIFIDSNSSLDTTWKVVKNLLEPIITPSDLPTHPVVKLRELCQRKGFTLEIRDFWKVSGEIEVVVDEDVVGKAKYSAKRVIAMNRAALDAYNKIVEKIHGLDVKLV
ncbi:ribonuclease 3 family protein [Striga asiatica]|uniref:Ribonuclease 3 family protein n=1 Tax=Striga asiatica TaxID=4170 RepID=A0A5A7PFM5_STRAF|nr:ribonuclease 3 family protein [Striga asiatica]